MFCCQLWFFAEVRTCRRCVSRWIWLPQFVLCWHMLLLPHIWWSNLLRRPHIFFFQVPTVELPHCRFPSGGTAMRWLRNAVCLLGCASCERTFGICRTSSRTGPHLLAFLASSSLASLPCEPGFFYQCGCGTPLHGFASLLPALLFSSSISSASVRPTAFARVYCPSLCTVRLWLGFSWPSSCLAEALLRLGISWTPFASYPPLVRCCDCLHLFFFFLARLIQL